ncbi:acyltransferase [Gallibacterium sp. AGMB14963]|uniref:acyltransferase n=1 Tax=Gallibacterium faecale TaxID=3019086 RepID=UPI0022F16D22|nr:acyltransferase [Gallibacterium sp. AGMB14963]MDA3978227.1 acyltransferase [Gallibacterium sp. AGMB14963]
MYRYDKCVFTTLKEAGLDISDLPFDEYELFLQITTKKFTIKQKLRALDVSQITSPLLVVSKKEHVVFVDKLRIDKTIANNYVPHVKTKQAILERGSFIDSANNQLIAPNHCVNCFVCFEGSNNLVEIHPEANIQNLYLELLGSNNMVKIGKNVKLHGTIRLGFCCELAIGKGTSSTNPIYATVAERTKLIIGKDCMFATNNQIRSDDAHAIYDVHTGKRINHSRDIVIGDHVWIGYGATIMGGAEIGSGSVVGAFSFVRKKFPNNCVIAGTPAKLVKKDIFWERPLLLRRPNAIDFTTDELIQKSYCQETKE